jgi:hypothetical protein
VTQIRGTIPATAEPARIPPRPPSAHIEDEEVESIPAELRAKPIWLAWKWQWKPAEGQGKAKWDKPPIGANGREIDATNPANLLGFDEARRVALSYGDGIGFALGKPDDRLGIVGIDLDHCIDDQGDVSDEAMRIVDLLQSYTYVTPSRRGLRVLVWGTKPGPKCKHTKREIEIYQADRYLTLTSLHLWEGPLPIADRQQELESLYNELWPVPDPKPGPFTRKATATAQDPSDDDLLDRARKAKNGAAFTALFDQGDTSGHSGDDSSADMALMNLLAFWTGRNASRMEALFSQSALGDRDKWRDRADYRQRTIEAAIQSCREVYEPSHNGRASGAQHATCAAAAAAGDFDNGPDGAAAGTAADGETHSQTLLRLASVATLFHDTDRRAYASIPVNGHAEVHAVKSTEFRLWLKGLFFAEQGRPPASQAFQDALGVLEALAVFQGQTEAVHVRVAGDADRIYVDLGDADWRAAEITAGGWRILDQSPIRFRRSRGMLAIPLPRTGGSLDGLKKFANCAAADFILIQAWLAAALRPTGPYPVLVLTGEQGSAKTTLAKMLKCLIDSHVLKSRSAPRDERDLAIAANGNWIVMCENVSSMPPWMSDAFCRLSTGSGFATRMLYSDDEEQLFAAQRAIVLEGITDFVDRADLMDRCIFVHLSPILDDDRRKEREVWEQFETAAPQLIGALFDAVAGGLKMLDQIRLTSLPRMADFAAFGEAVSQALGNDPGRFINTYRDNRKTANESALDDSPVAAVVRKLSLPWDGSASELLFALNGIASAEVRESKHWPKSPRGISGAIRRLAPQLRMVAINVDFHRDPSGKDRTRTIEIRAIESNGKQPSGPSGPSPPHENKAEMPDGSKGRPSGTVRQPSGDLPYKTRLPDEPDDSDGPKPNFLSTGEEREIIEL